MLSGTYPLASPARHTAGTPDLRRARALTRGALGHMLRMRRYLRMSSLLAIRAAQAPSRVRPVTALNAVPAMFFMSEPFYYAGRVLPAQDYFRGRGPSRELPAARGSHPGVVQDVLLELGHEFRGQGAPGLADGVQDVTRGHLLVAVLE